jgi:hypothetical protein
MKSHSWTLALVLFAAVGCAREEPIETRTVARPAETDRMLGAIVPRGGQAWFFKLAGAADVVDRHEDAFEKFIQSIEFPDTENGRPKWTLPEGWREEAGSGMRVATLRMGDAGQELELTVIPLPRGDENDDEYVLTNVNRWRGQLGLGPINREKLAEVVTKLGDGPDAVTVVKLSGKLVPGGMR